MDGANRILRDTTFAVALKHLNNFWRTLETPLINYKDELKLHWTKHCVLVAARVDNVNANDDHTTFTKYKDTKLNDPVVTLSSKNNQKLLDHFGKGLERLVYWS